MFYSLKSIQLEIEFLQVYVLIIKQAYMDYTMLHLLLEPSIIFFMLLYVMIAKLKEVRQFFYKLLNCYIHAVHLTMIEIVL